MLSATGSDTAENIIAECGDPSSVDPTAALRRHCPEQPRDMFSAGACRLRRGTYPDLHGVLGFDPNGSGERPYRKDLTTLMERIRKSVE